MNLLGAVRPMRARTIAAFCLVVAVIAVGIALPRRWDGAYGARGSFIPLRPPTVPEAAALIKCEWAGVIGLTPKFAYVNTRVFLQPRTPLLLPSGALRCPDSKDEVRGVDKGGTEVDFRLRHRVDRAAVEQLLGRPLTNTDVKPTTGTTSYISYRWWMFAAGDALFIAFFYFVLILILRRIGRPSSWFALPAIIVAFELAWIVGILAYSPASYLGGSGHYHRVLVEDGPWPHLSWFLPPFVDPGSVLLTMAIGGMAILGLVRIRQWIPVVGRVRPVRYWTLIAAVMVGSMLLLSFDAYHQFEIDRSSARKTVDAVVSLFPDVESAILGDEALRQAAATVHATDRGEAMDRNLLRGDHLRDRTTDAVRQLLGLRTQDERLYVYVGIGGQAFATVFGSPRYQSVTAGALREYVDESSSKGFTEDGNAFVVEAMLHRTQELSQPFGGYLFRQHREGRLLRRHDATIVGVAIVETESTSPRLRGLALSVCGFECKDVDWGIRRP